MTRVYECLHEHHIWASCHGAELTRSNQELCVGVDCAKAVDVPPEPGKKMVEGNDLERTKAVT